MSLHKVPYTKVLEVNPHPNADRLELLTIYGFQVVATKGRYQVGQPVVFVPVDSVLPQWLEDQLFPPEEHLKIGRIKRSGDRRVRQIRIRKFPSQGMVIDPQDLDYKFGRFWNSPRNIAFETDLAEKLEIIKYEPPFADHGPRVVQKRNKPLENPRFHQYKGCENIKWFPNLFKEGDEIVVQEKLHGSNCRASIQPAVANTLWKKVKKFLGLLPEFERCYGSNMVQLQERPGHTGYYGEDVYGAVLHKVDAFSRMLPGETIYGELIGPGIQKGYDYGLKEHDFVLFDVKVTKEDGTQDFLDPEDAEAYAKTRGFRFVPILFKGLYDKNKIASLVEGPSVHHPGEPVKEGIVIKAAKEYGQNGSKKALKFINPQYLDNPNNTDNH
jgi:RNA ligase (TIGR02306 family)